MPENAPPKVWPRFTQGIDRRQPEDALLDGFLSDTTNMRHRSGGAVEADYGFAPRAATTAIRGQPQLIRQHTFNSGTSEVLLVTTLTFYTYVLAADQWQYAAGPGATTCANAGVATDTYIDVAASAGFTDGDFMGIILDTGVQWQTTVNGAPSVGGGAGGSDRINIDDALPSGVAGNNAVVAAVVLTSSAGQPVSAISWKPDDWFVFNNTADKPYKYDGATCIVVPGLGTPIVTSAKWITTIHNQIMLIAPTENGTYYPSRIRGCDLADGSTWDDAGSGGAFYEDIPEDVGHMVRGEPLGDNLALYFQRGICLYEYLSAGSLVWRYRLVLSSEGLAAPNALVAVQGTHYFLGNYDVYEWKGGPTVTPAGGQNSILQAADTRSAIQPLIFGLDADVDRSTLDESFMVHLSHLNEIWLVVPNGASALVQGFRFNFLYRGWLRRTLPTASRAGALIAVATGLTWADMTGTWGGTVGTWGSYGDQRIETWFCAQGTTNGEILGYSPNVSDDDGTAIAWTLITGNFRTPPKKMRLETIDVLASGGAFVIELSEDGGSTWSSIATLTPAGSKLERMRAHPNRVVESAQIRLSGSVRTRFEWCSLIWQPESME